MDIFSSCLPNYNFKDEAFHIQEFPLSEINYSFLPTFRNNEHNT